MIREWLEVTVCLPQYYEVFVKNGYESLDFIKEINDREELEVIGIMLLGHQTKFLAEIKRLNAFFDTDLRCGARIMSRIRKSIYAVSRK